MDLALHWNADLGVADLALLGADLATEQGLRTAVIASLFTDARAADDEALPDPADADRRGWWGNAFAEDGGQPVPVGSKLWLRTRAFGSEPTRRQIEADCREALAWVVSAGVAGAVDVSSEWLSPYSQLLVRIAIRRSAGQAQATHAWDFIWRAEGVI
jgi:phage gp46-like protein